MPKGVARGTGVRSTWPDTAATTISSDAGKPSSPCRQPDRGNEEGFRFGLGTIMRAARRMESYLFDLRLRRCRACSVRRAYLRGALWRTWAGQAVTVLLQVAVISWSLRPSQRVIRTDPRQRGQARRNRNATRANWNR